MFKFFFKFRWSALLIIVFSFVIGTSLVWADSASKNKQFTADFNLGECIFSNTGGNTYFSIDPASDPILLEGEEDGELVQVKIIVAPETEFVDGVSTRVVEEWEWIDGELIEVSKNFFARCEETNAIYYFGEDVFICEDGFDQDALPILDCPGGVSNEGQWRAGDLAPDGVSFNEPGLIMPGTFLLGSRYYQEIAPDVALDRGENIEMGLTVDTPARTFNDCVKVKETTPLEPSSKDIKIYAPGDGLIVDATLERVTVLSP